MIVAGQNETVDTDENFATDYFGPVFSASYAVDLIGWPQGAVLSEANLYSLRVGLSAITSGEGQDTLIAHITKRCVCHPTDGKCYVAELNQKKSVSSAICLPETGLAQARQSVVRTRLDDVSAIR
jgi:hypothetical protein